MNPFPFFSFDYGTRPQYERRWPAYTFSTSVDGECEVVSSEPGGSQRATWTQWAPAKDPIPEREPTQTVFEHPGRKEPTEEFKDLVAAVREMNDPSPNLKRAELRRGSLI
jgi:hypothetical protein